MRKAWLSPRVPGCAMRGSGGKAPGCVRSIADLLFQHADQGGDTAAILADDGGEFLAVRVGEAETFDL